MINPQAEAQEESWVSGIFQWIEPAELVIRPFISSPPTVRFGWVGGAELVCKEVGEELLARRGPSLVQPPP